MCIKKENYLGHTHSSQVELRIKSNSFEGVVKRPESDPDRKETAHILKTVFGVVSRINRVWAMGCVTYFRFGDLSLIRLNWGMLHLTFMLRTLKMVYSGMSVSGKESVRR